jgi:hypothetical protein
MRSNMTMLTFVLVIFFAFDYFAMNGRTSEWLWRSAQDTGLELKSDMDSIIDHSLRGR